MNTRSSTAATIQEVPPAARPRLLPKPQSQPLGDFFHCRHGVPEHQRCVKCEEESQGLPSFWDD